jgi:hypothetical protein
MSSELGRRSEGFIMGVVSGNSYEAVAVGDETRAILGDVNTDDGSVNYGGGTINYNNGRGDLCNMGPVPLMNLGIQQCARLSSISYLEPRQYCCCRGCKVSIRRATESSLPTNLRQTTRDNRPAKIASKLMSQRGFHVKPTRSLNVVRNRVGSWDVNGLDAKRPEIRRDGFLKVNRLRPIQITNSIAYMTARLFLQSMWPISGMPD